MSRSPAGPIPALPIACGLERHAVVGDVVDAAVVDEVIIRLGPVAPISGRVLRVSARAGRQLWELTLCDPLAAGGVAPLWRSLFVKRFESRAPYERERLAMTQADDRFVAQLVADFADLRVLVLAGLAGQHLDAAPPGRHLAWMQAGLEAVLNVVGLPGPWPLDPPPRLSTGQHAVAAGLCARIPAAGRALARTLAAPLMVACHGDISPTNLLVDDRWVAGPPRAWLLDFEFYGPGDVLADLAALCLTPSLSVPMDDRLRLLRGGCAVIEERTGLRLANRLAGSIALWAVQCATWHLRDLGDAAGRLVAEQTLDLAAWAVAAVEGS